MLLCIAQTPLSCCVMSEGKLVVCLLDHKVLQVGEAHVTQSVAQEIAQHAQPVRTLVNGRVFFLCFRVLLAQCLLFGSASASSPNVPYLLHERREKHEYKLSDH